MNPLLPQNPTEAAMSKDDLLRKRMLESPEYQRMLREIVENALRNPFYQRLRSQLQHKTPS